MRKCCWSAIVKVFNLIFLVPPGLDCWRCWNSRQSRSADIVEDHLEHGLRTAETQKVAGSQQLAERRRPDQKLKEHSRTHRSRSFRFLWNSRLPVTWWSLRTPGWRFPGFARPSSHVWHSLFSQKSAPVFQICAGNLPWSVRAVTLSPFHQMPWKTWLAAQKLHPKYRHARTGNNMIGVCTPILDIIQSGP